LIDGVIVVRKVSDFDEGFAIKQIRSVRYQQSNLTRTILLHLCETRCQPNLPLVQCPSTFTQVYEAMPLHPGDSCHQLDPLCVPPTIKYAPRHGAPPSL